MRDHLVFRAVLQPNLGEEQEWILDDDTLPDSKIDTSARRYDALSEALDGDPDMTPEDFLQSVQDDELKKFQDPLENMTPEELLEFVQNDEYKKFHEDSDGEQMNEGNWLGEDSDGEQMNEGNWLGERLEQIAQKEEDIEPTTIPADITNEKKRRREEWNAKLLEAMKSRHKDDELMPALHAARKEQFLQEADRVQTRLKMQEQATRLLQEQAKRSRVQTRTR